MEMNRETKRMLQRQGQVDSDGEVATRSRAKSGPASPVSTERTKPLDFLREVKSELSKVAWPTRSEVINYSIIVLITLIVITSFIAAIDWLVGDFVLRLYKAS